MDRPQIPQSNRPEESLYSGDTSRLPRKLWQGCYSDYQKTQSQALSTTQRHGTCQGDMYEVVDLTRAAETCMACKRHITCSFIVKPTEPFAKAEVLCELCAHRYPRWEAMRIFTEDQCPICYLDFEMVDEWATPCGMALYLFVRS